MNPRLNVCNRCEEEFEPAPESESEAEAGSESAIKSSPESKYEHVSLATAPRVNSASILMPFPEKKKAAELHGCASQARFHWSSRGLPGGDPKILISVEGRPSKVAAVVLATVGISFAAFALALTEARRTIWGAPAPPVTRVWRVRGR